MAQLIERFARWLAGDGRWIGGFDALNREVEPIAARLVLNFAALLLVWALAWDTMYWEGKATSLRSAKAVRHLRRCCFAIAAAGFLFPIVQLWWPAWRLWYVLVLGVLFEGSIYLRARLQGVVIFSQDREQIESVKTAVMEIKHMTSVATEIVSKLADEQQELATKDQTAKDQNCADAKSTDKPWHYLNPPRQ